MPEAAEVKIMGDLLKRYLEGNKMKIEIVGGRNMKKNPKNYKELQEIMEKGGIEVGKVETKGKFLWIEMEEEWSCWITFGLKGRFYEEKKDNCGYTIESRIGKIYYCDTIGYGTLTISNNRKELEKKLKTLGSNILGQTKISDSEIIKTFRKYDSKNVTVVMMNPKVFAGIGNYMKCESLYISKVSPHSLVKELKDEQLVSLYNNCRQLSQQIYNNLTNNPSFCKTSLFHVYNRSFDKLSNPILTIKTPDDRKTHWCPSVQDNTD